MSSKNSLSGISSYIKSKCLHSNKVELASLNASELYIDSNIKNSNILIKGIHAKKCTKCNKVFTDNEVLIERLKPVILKLSEKLPVENVEIHFDKSDSTVSEQNDLRNDSSRIPPFEVMRSTLELEDSILNLDTKIQIEEAITKIKYFDKIYLEWGFGKVDPIGRGAVLNFWGNPGTGKTRTAEALAGELNLPILNVNLADLESSFMGQTAKNIVAAFKKAKQEGAILFFDEADTVLGKRLSSVTQGVDAEINLSRSTMLKELERFKGICVFATNFEKNIDVAFRRRILYHIHFGLPSEETRKKLWDYFLIDSIPLEKEKEKEQIVEEVTEITEGFTGADIRNVLRLALPMAIKINPKETTVMLNHILESINRIKDGKKYIG